MIRIDNLTDNNGNLIDRKTMNKIVSKWSKSLIKEINKTVKQKTPSWFGAKFNKKWTPFKIRYNARERSIYLWGNPPNENVNKQHGKSKYIPWGKTTKQSASSNYHWSNPHFHRVYISSSEIDLQGNKWFGARRKNTSGGFWFTAKKKFEGDGHIFYTKRSHDTIHANKQGYTRESGQAGREYVFPVKWYATKSEVQFVYEDHSVADELMKDEDTLGSIIDSTLSAAMSKFV